jgi:hypothetical protein
MIAMRTHVLALSDGFDTDLVAVLDAWGRGVTLRALLRRRLGRSVREIRRSL